MELKETHPNWTTADTLAEGRAAKLVNLASDLQEIIDLSRHHPEVVKRMKSLAQEAVQKFRNDERNGIMQRDPVDVPNPTAMALEQ